MTQPPSPDQPPFGAPPQPAATPPPPYGAPPSPAQPAGYTSAPSGYPTGPAGYPAAPPSRYATPQPVYSAPPQPQPYGAPPQPYGAPPTDFSGGPVPHGAPAAFGQPGQPGVHAYVGTPPGQRPPELPGIPGGSGRSYTPLGIPGEQRKRPSGWNPPAFGLLAIALTLVAIIVWPQLRARSTEAHLKPVVQALSQRDATARCPRYITSVLTNAASVSLDDAGRIADRTDLTGPICDALRDYYKPGGKASLDCLTQSTTCSDRALHAIVAFSVVVHESMHLRGQLDEGRAECESIGESATLSSSLGISMEQARMISWLHYAGMNPSTPPEYQISPADCQFVAELEASPPGTPEAREMLAQAVNQTWERMAS